MKAGENHSTRTPERSGGSQEHTDFNRKWFVLVAIGIGSFMTALDGSVVNTVLPVLRAAFSSSIANVEWVVTIYLLILSGLVLSFGRLGDMRGHKVVYLAGFFIFITSSALCGLSSSVTVLIIFRGIQALGASMLQANSPAILIASFPSRQRGQALGMQATMTYIGLTVGPSLGGFLADQFSWRAVFYINVPVGLIALLLGWRFIASDAITDVKEKFDFRGAALFMSGLILLLFGLNQGYALGWTSWPILLSLGFGLAILAAFVLTENRVEKPMLDFSLFSSRIFTATVTSSVINYIGVYTVIFLMPFYLIQGLGLTASQAGLILTAMPIVMAVVAPISGTISDRIGTRLPTTIGMILLTGGLYYLSGLGLHSPLAQVAFRLAITGLGIGTFISPNTSAMMGAAPRERQGIASAILATSRNFGMVLGVGLAGAFFTSFLSTHPTSTGASVVSAIQSSLMVAGVITGVGILISAFRPSDRLQQRES